MSGELPGRLAGWPCPHCRRGFHSLAGLNVHVGRVHQDVRRRELAQKAAQDPERGHGWPQARPPILPRTEITADTSWMSQGACVGAPNPALWFPDRGASTEPAKAICAACPVKAECLDYALEAGEKYGCWGGTSERERRRMRRERKKRAA